MFLNRTEVVLFQLFPRSVVPSFHRSLMLSFPPFIAQKNQFLSQNRKIPAYLNSSTPKGGVTLVQPKVRLLPPCEGGWKGVHRAWYGEIKAARIDSVPQIADMPWIINYHCNWRIGAKRQPCNIPRGHPTGRETII